MPIELAPDKRMFGWIDETWNPVKGCRHGCKYCWARHLATTKLRRQEKYKDGFRPRLWTRELRKTFRKKKSIFVCDMGDLFGQWIDGRWIENILEVIDRSSRETQFLLLTKNPRRFAQFADDLHDDLRGNVILGTTIETNRNYPVTRKGAASPPQSRYHRYMSMKSFDWPRKFVAIEPVMDFDSETLEQWIREIKPQQVSVSYDNYGHELTEPSKEKTVRFCRRLGASLRPKITVHLHGDWVKQTSKCPDCGRKHVIEFEENNGHKEMCFGCGYETKKG